MKCLLARPTSGSEVKDNAKQDKENSKVSRKPRKVPLPQVTADKDDAARAKEQRRKGPEARLSFQELPTSQDLSPYGREFRLAIAAA